jgi:hypothetical protein
MLSACRLPQPQAATVNTMIRIVTLVAGILAGVILALGGLYLLTLVWPGLFSPAPTPTITPIPPTSTRRPTLTPVLTATPDPAVPTVDPLERVVGEELTATPNPAGEPLGGTGFLPLARADLQRPYEDLGFSFQLANLGDDQEHWVAASPDQLALVELVGADDVEAASVSVFGPVSQDDPDGPQRAIYLLTMLRTLLPGWEGGVAWFGDQIVSMSRAGGDYSASTTYAGLRLTLTQDTREGAIILTFAPQ